MYWCLANYPNLPIILRPPRHWRVTSCPISRIWRFLSRLGMALSPSAQAVNTTRTIIPRFVSPAISIVQRGRAPKRQFRQCKPTRTHTLLLQQNVRLPEAHVLLSFFPSPSCVCFCCTPAKPSKPSIGFKHVMQRIWRYGSLVLRCFRSPRALIIRFLFLLHFLFFDVIRIKSGRDRHSANSSKSSLWEGC